LPDEPVTFTTVNALTVAPELSVTVNVALNTPAELYTWDGFAAPELGVLSPKLQT
jgi:hypothetical protein